MGLRELLAGRLDLGGVASEVAGHVGPGRIEGVAVHPLRLSKACAVDELFRSAHLGARQSLVTFGDRQQIYAFIFQISHGKGDDPRLCFAAPPTFGIAFTAEKMRRHGAIALSAG